MNSPIPNPQLTAEEVAERVRHDVLYAQERQSVTDLRLVPHDWERFDRPARSHGAYNTSVEWMGDITGKRVLDLGCGTGWFSVILAHRGARQVDGFDISPEAVRMARERVEANQVQDRCNLVEGSAYDIPWPENSYDVVAGQAIIHHVRNKELVAEEVHRVLKPGGVAVFHEPFGNLPAFERLRQMLPFQSDTDDPDHWKDKLTLEQLEPFRRRFDLRFETFELVVNLSRYFPPLRAPLAGVDHLLLSFSPLQHFARAIVIGLRKR